MEHQEQDRAQPMASPGRLHANRWLVLTAVVLVIVAGMAAIYGYRQQAVANQLASHDVEMNATINQLHSQVDLLTAKLNELASAQSAAAAPAKAPQGAPAPASAKAAATKRRSAEDRRLKQIQSRLTDQEKQLKDTQEQVAKTRSDLEGALSSTREELTGSIARTHEELVVLQKRGERNYFEFDLAKSKSFQRAGPLQISLRKADAKHRRYNLEFLVDDNELSKKNVNLYEPIWIHRADDPQPMQVVVNRVEKNRVHGYVSAPKYRNSELAANVTPVSATTPATNPAAPTQPPRPQEPPE